MSNALPLQVVTSRYASGNGTAHVYVADASGKKVAAVWGTAEGRYDTAYTFAAAPDLLAALKFVETDPCFSQLGSVTHDEVRAAIAKSEGR